MKIEMEMDDELSDEILKAALVRCFDSLVLHCRDAVDKININGHTTYLWEELLCGIREVCAAKHLYDYHFSLTDNQIDVPAFLATGSSLADATAEPKPKKRRKTHGKR